MFIYTVHHVGNNSQNIMAVSITQHVASSRGLSDMLAYCNRPIRAVICQFQWSCFLVLITITCRGQQFPIAMRMGTSEEIYLVHSYVGC